MTQYMTKDEADTAAAMQNSAYGAVVGGTYIAVPCTRGGWVVIVRFPR